MKRRRIQPGSFWLSVSKILVLLALAFMLALIFSYSQNVRAEVKSTAITPSGNQPYYPDRRLTVELTLDNRDLSRPVLCGIDNHHYR